MKFVVILLVISLPCSYSTCVDKLNDLLQKALENKVFHQSFDGFPQERSTEKPLIEIVQKGETKEKAVRVNGIAVTFAGEADPFMVSSQRLGLGLDSEKELAALSGKNILSIGEGVGPHVASMLDHGLKIKGLDIWYSQLDKLRGAIDPDTFKVFKQFVDKYEDYLVTGSVFNIPYDDNTFDLLIASRLLNNLNKEDVIRALKEMVRVLKPGGEIRIKGIQRGFSKDELQVLFPNIEFKVNDDYFIFSKT